jgi:NAD(P)-dependent dehydrogenase (short-subunit alcohol dehydrogenase family)
MAPRGHGSSISLSSPAGGLVGGAAYGASKASLEAMTRAWAAEYSASGVRLNAIGPGPVCTPTRSGPELITALRRNHAMHRAAQPWERAARFRSDRQRRGRCHPASEAGVARSHPLVASHPATRTRLPTRTVHRLMRSRAIATTVDAMNSPTGQKRPCEQRISRRMSWPTFPALSRHMASRIGDRHPRVSVVVAERRRLGVLRTAHRAEPREESHV